MIRRAVPEDGAAIAAIYDWYVENTTVSYEITLPDAQEMARRICHIEQEYPFLVYEEASQVIGYAYAAAFHEREAFAPTVEVSIYFDNERCGGGCGKKLFDALLQQLQKNGGYHMLIAAIDGNNAGSRRFFEQQGFVHCGSIAEVAYKMGRWLELHYYRKQI